MPHADGIADDRAGGGDQARACKASVRPLGIKDLPDRADDRGRGAAERRGMRVAEQFCRES